MTGRRAAPEGTGGPGGRSKWLLLAAVLAIETVLVVGAFNPAPHTGGDNAMYVSLAEALLTTHSYVERFDPAGLPHTKYPPVFPALLAVLIALGARSWVALKSVAAVSTIAATGFAYLWAARRAGPWTGVAVALLLGASSAVVYYSHWVLSDPSFLAFTMIALWALDASDAGGQEAPRGPGVTVLLSLGVAAAGLAYLTRSAGLPLVLALGAWLAWRRRWRALGASAIAIGIPALMWWWRGRGVPGSYAAEFWLVDPYQPELGRIGIGALVPRAITNATGYVLTHGPAGIVGTRGPWVSALGIALVLAAVGGWVACARRRVGPAELFFPLYAGLILLWPVVWSGDRFALPLYPLVFFYGAVALTELVRRAPRIVGNLVVAGALLAMLLPASASWAREASASRACARVVAAEGAWACYGPRVGAFVEAAQWAATGLPEGAAVLTRKPGIFYVSSGVPSRTFAFSADPAVHLALADSLGARYVLLDEWDGLANAYVGGAVGRSPGAFCFVRSFGRPGAGGAQLLGILPRSSRVETPASTSESIRIGACPADFTTGSVAESQSSSSNSTAVPLLSAMDP